MTEAEAFCQQLIEFATRWIPFPPLSCHSKSFGECELCRADQNLTQSFPEQVDK